MHEGCAQLSESLPACLAGSDCERRYSVHNLWIATQPQAANVRRTLLWHRVPGHPLPRQPDPGAPPPRAPRIITRPRLHGQEFPREGIERPIALAIVAVEAAGDEIAVLDARTLAGRA